MGWSASFLLVNTGLKRHLNIKCVSEGKDKLLWSNQTRFVGEKKSGVGFDQHED